VLPGALSGPVYLVAQGTAFPNLDVLLEGDGVHVILEGNTNIKSGITTSTFASIPDVPVSSFVLDLPWARTRPSRQPGTSARTPDHAHDDHRSERRADQAEHCHLRRGLPVRSFRHKIRILHRKIVGHTLILTCRAWKPVASPPPVERTCGRCIEVSASRRP